MRAKLFIPHRKDCAALRAVRRGDWDSPWFLDECPTTYKFVIYADSLCRKNKGTWHRWIALRCNETDCPARVRIDSNEIESLAQKLLIKAKP